MIGRKKKTGQAPGKTPAPGKGAAAAKSAGKRRRRRSGRGVLWVIAMMFVMSGLLRFGGETGRAIASEIAGEGGDGHAADGGEHAAEAMPTDNLAEVLALLREREEKVAAREAALEDRMQALAVAEEQVTTNLAKLEEVEASLKATMAMASTAAEDDLSRLTTVYENMKPKDAAPLFAAMDPQFAAGFLGRMRADAAAAIMAGLDPDAAYTISVLLAGRNARVPTE